MKGSKGKAPSVQWYYKDWLSDKQLQRARPSTRGIWMNLLMFMIDCPSDRTECKSGRLEYVTIRELCSLGGCNEDEAWMFLEDALAHQFCNIELDKFETFHIMSRRLSNDAEQRAKWRDKKQKQRKKPPLKNDVHRNVPYVSPKSPTLSPTPTLKGVGDNSTASGPLKGPPTLGGNQYKFPVCPHCNENGSNIIAGHRCPYCDKFIKTVNWMA